MKEIATALLKAQSEMSNPTKGSSNPYFKSKYADLNAVREAVIPVLNQNGIVVLQPIVSIEGKNFVKTVLLHESGETLDSLTEIIYSKTNDAQAQGSGITYARRYGLQSLVCVGADDDDGNAASTPPKQPAKTQSSNLIKQVETAGDLPTLMKIWEDNPNMHTDFKFKQAMSKRKNELQNE